MTYKGLTKGTYNYTQESLWDEKPAKATSTGWTTTTGGSTGVYTGTYTTGTSTGQGLMVTHGQAALDALWQVRKALREMASYSDSMCEDCAAGNEWLDRDAVLAEIDSVMKSRGIL